MKKNLLSVIFVVMAFLSFSQIATNFTCEDCKGTSHDLFSELDAGKVIVLCWVMPCGACVGPSLTTYNVVESYQASNPDKVYMYLCDDFANTNCTSLSSWATGNNIINVTCFSNAVINMSDYGEPGMPKIVVVAGTDHLVLYNTNNTVNAELLQAAIDSALATSGINENSIVKSSATILPNPVNGKSVISFEMNETRNVKIDLLSSNGAWVRDLFTGILSQGKNNIELNLGSDDTGIYYIRIRDGKEIHISKAVVIH
jgi:hypothetical protein